MKAFSLCILILVILTSCLVTTNNDDQKALETTSLDKKVLIDTTPRVTGIGGIFFMSDDPQATKDWYSQNLGLQMNDWGSSFEFRNAHRPDEVNYLTWSPFKSGNEYMSPSKKDFMVNYRVRNIEGLLKKLKGNGVTIVDTIQEYDYGKFVHIMDTDGHKIELWEPKDSVLTALGGVTTK